MAEGINNLTELEPLTKDPKAQEDYSKEAEALIARAKELSSAGRVEEAVEEIMTLEKRARNACDAISVSKLCKCLLTIYKEHKKWDSVNEYLLILTKKRGQLKRAIIDMVQLCMEWLDTTPSKDEKVKLINNLSGVTEGKIFVEVERARLVRVLSKMKETEGNIVEAANLLQEVQVETFGAMDRREKAEYILDQMRLVLLRGDFVRCQIISKKINTKLLEADDFQDIKLRYYEFMVRYWLHEENYMEVCKSYWAMYSTKSVKDDTEKCNKTLEAYLLYLLLAPISTEQKDRLHKLQTLEKKKMEAIPALKQFLTDFLRAEVLSWPLPPSYAATLQGSTVFKEQPHEGGKKRWELLHKRVVQHNVLVIGSYYKRMTLQGLAKIVSLPVQEAENEVSELVSSKSLFAKIDRPARQITFGEILDSSGHLDTWVNDIQKILDLVDESCHLIQKEKMVHAARVKTAV